MNKKTMYLTHAAAIAALYVVLTFLANAFGLANYAVQLRFSEALTILPFFTPAAIPGLFVGCLLSNIFTGAALPDIIFGSLATLIGARPAHYCQRRHNSACPAVCLWHQTSLVLLLNRYPWRNPFLRCSWHAIAFRSAEICQNFI